MTTKREALEMAIAATADRGQNYGRPSENFERIATRWRAHIRNRFGVDVGIDAASVAIMMLDMKTARLEHSPDHLDSWVDAAGYAACGAEISSEEVFVFEKPQSVGGTETGQFLKYLYKTRNIRP